MIDEQARASLVWMGDSGVGEDGDDSGKEDDGLGR
jgi:hypothetical protein